MKPFNILSICVGIVAIICAVYAILCFANQTQFSSYPNPPYTYMFGYGVVFSVLVYVFAQIYKYEQSK